MAKFDIDPLIMFGVGRSALTNLSNNLIYFSVFKNLSLKHVEKLKMMMSVNIYLIMFGVGRSAFANLSN